MISTSAFQAESESSILSIRSIGKIAKLVNAQDCKSLRWQFESVSCLQNLARIPSSLMVEQW